MNTTVPTKTRNVDVIVLPRREYEAFYEWKNTRNIKEFTPTASELHDLKKAREDFIKGNYITLNEFQRGQNYS